MVKRTMRVVKAKPPDIATLLLELGRRRLVLLEGDSDFDALNEWFLEHERRIMFHVPGGGWRGVETFLQQVLAEGVTERVFGIIDRDFRDEVEVENSLSDPVSHLFILRRYAIENYLLEPEALQEELRVFYGAKFVVPDVSVLRGELLRMCQELCTAMAAQWTLLESGGEFLPDGFNISRRELVVLQVAARLGIDATDAEQRVAAKEALIAPNLTTLEAAHACIDGKFLIHKVYDKYIHAVGSGFVKDHLFRLLVRTVKQQGVHVDIRDIVEGRILT